MPWNAAHVDSAATYDGIPCLGYNTITQLRRYEKLILGVVHGTALVTLFMMAALALSRTSLLHKNVRNLAEKVKEYVGIARRSC